MSQCTQCLGSVVPLAMFLHKKLVSRRRARSGIRPWQIPDLMWHLGGKGCQRRWKVLEKGSHHQQWKVLKSKCVIWKILNLNACLNNILICTIFYLHACLNFLVTYMFPQQFLYSYLFVQQYSFWQLNTCLHVCLNRSFICKLVFSGWVPVNLDITC